ncbi:SMP-30/Gluconolaconase/LRE-like region [Stieleria bergensis]|uniref:SMP-30/Gluconolaconase/LRE-like region n=2 Tax=Stieleria bergensis TaxID=2528025 RepID=A0A517SX93_9BACT|nr:SMP-30/Gluconolaconase/LRE-like region [Planctomycetes bacterium SV_7m_r]
MVQVLETTPLDFPMSSQLRFLPEGPYPLGPNQLSWVGIQHGATATQGSLNLLDLKTMQNTSLDLPGRPGFAFPCQTPGQFIVGCERSLGLFDTNDQSWQELIGGVDDDVTNTIINDGLVYQDNLIFGTKDLEFATKKAGLYLYRGSDNQLIRLRDDQLCSNGKATVVVDGQLSLIDIDSPTRQIVRYPLDIQAGTLGTREVIIDLTDDPAVPDGMILTPDGTRLIVAMFLPQAATFGETRMYDLASGELLVTWRTPLSSQNTCPALVELDGQLKLVITTAVENMTAEDQAMCSNAGKLFIGDSSLEYAVLDAPVFPR